MSITIPPEYPGSGKAKVGDVLVIKVKVTATGPTGLTCDIVTAPAPVKKPSVLEYLKSVNKKPITQTPKALAI